MGGEHRNSYLRGAISWFAARAHGEQLDQMIAEGSELQATALDAAWRRRCEARERVLVRRHLRHALAAELEDLLALAAGETLANRPLRTAWTVDLDTAEILEASESLRLLVARLKAPARPRAQGVAQALMLLRDGRSPLYDAHAAGDLKRAAESAARALESPPTATVRRRI
jgi:hypothetical protein